MAVRDWLPIVGALLVPLVIALGIWGITWQLEKLENQRARQTQKLENQRAEAEQELAEQRAQDEALQAYLDQMGTLLLEKDLLNAQQDSEVVTLARARTLTVLERLDPSRRTAVMQFLIEAQLVFRGMVQLDPVIELHGANLGEIDLSGLVANLSGASLSGAILSDADLSGAYLRGAELKGANLNNAQGITNEELEQRAASLEGATMPNGQKYEDWLKGSGEDG